MDYGVERLKESILKNFGEFAEFIYCNFGISNYYDLVDKIIYDHNFKIMLLRKDEKLYKKICKELKKELEENE